MFSRIARIFLVILVIKGLLLASLVSRDAQTQVKGRNEALIVGGSCENGGQKYPLEECKSCDRTGPMVGQANLFRLNFQKAWIHLQKAGWSVEMQYDSDHWERPWPGSKPASSTALLKSIQDRIDPGPLRLKAGDQFLLGIATHGAPGQHEVCIGNQFLPISVVLAKLQELTKQGVRVAVIDQSCFGGRTVDLVGDTGICAISGTGSKTTNGGHEHWDVMMESAVEAGGRKLSASDAFYRAQMNDSAQMLKKQKDEYDKRFSVGQMSDCSLRAGGLRETLNEVSQFLRAEFGLLTKTPNFRFPTLGEACQLSDLPLTFKAVLNQAQEIDKILARVDLMRVSGNIFQESPEKLLYRIERNVQQMQDLIAEARVDQAALDRHFIKGEPFAKDVKERFLRKNKEADKLKQAILADLRPLLFYACSIEKFQKQGVKKRTCEEFNLNPRGGH